MLDLDRMIQAGLAGAGASAALLAAPFDLAEHRCRILVEAGQIAGYVADRAPTTDDVAVVGWWMNRREKRWIIRESVARTIIFLGSERQVGEEMLAAARRSGVTTILLVAPDASGIRKLRLDVGPWRSWPVEIVRHLLGRPAGQRASPAGQGNDLSFESAFDDLYRLVDDRWRIPPSEIVPGRVLILTGSLGPGGAERQIAYTASGIVAKHAAEVIVGCSSLDPPIADFYRADIENAGAKTCLVRRAAPGGESAESARIRARLSGYDVLGFHNVVQAVHEYALLIRTLRPSVVHAWMDYCNVLAGIAADLAGVPRLVLSGRSAAPEHFGIFQPYMRPGYQSLLRRRSLVFLNNSQAGAADYARWLGLPSERFQVIRNGFIFPHMSIEQLRVAERRKHGIPPGAPVVGSIIRFSEEKQPLLLLSVAEQLVARHPGVRILLFGDGPLLAEARSYVTSRRLSDAIKLPGITQDAWASLAAMDVFVLASRMEGLPNVLVEAQGCGVPVVCTAVGGAPETFIDGVTGFGVARADAASIADKVSLLIADVDVRKRMSARAFSHARDEFGAARMIDETFEVYAAAGAANDEVSSRREDFVDG
jgi:glycosyltransferase involved in cell wall biosynthesis